MSVSIPTKTPDDVVCASRDKSVPFRPSHVQWNRLVDYLVVHTVAEHVSDQIDRGRGRGVVSNIEIRNEDIVASVEAEMLKLLGMEPCVEVRRILGQLSNRDSLRQITPIVIKNLLQEGKKACAAANESEGGSQCNVAWNTNYKPERVKGAMVLTIGYGA